MGCCGQKRAAASATAVASPPPAPRLDQHLDQAVVVRYLQRSRVLVIGSATGRRYEFSGGNPVQPVDRRDAEPLLRSPFFSKWGQ